MNFTHEQIILAFAYMAYYGVAFEGADSKNDLIIAGNIQDALHAWPCLNNEWELVWGPRVSAFEGDHFDDNMMYVVKNKTYPLNYVIAIRGTNPFSIKDWIFEDFDVFPMVKWPYGTQQKLKPKISKAVSIGLCRLQHMIATDGTPGAGQSLLEFLQSELLQSELSEKEVLNICVTGHSLGGALAPTLALWLKDIQNIDLSNKVHISTVAFAGPTVGNADFAQYSDQRFELDCIRIANSLDVVPHAWNTKSLFKLYSLYAEHFLLPGPVLVGGFSLMIAMSWRSNYTQIKSSTKPLRGVYKHFLYNYFAQAIYQHVIGYPELMGMLTNQNIPLAELFSPQFEFVSHQHGLEVAHEQSSSINRESRF